MTAQRHTRRSCRILRPIIVGDAAVTVSPAPAHAASGPAFVQGKAFTTGSSQNLSYTLEASSDSASTDLMSIGSGGACAQHAFTLPISTDWYALCAVFQPG